MRGLILIALVGTGCGDPLVRKLQDDRSYCPTSWEEAGDTYLRLKCERPVRCGWTDQPIDVCMNSDPLTMYPGGRPPCFNDCGVRDDLLWYLDRADDCEERWPPLENFPFDAC